MSSDADSQAPDSPNRYLKLSKPDDTSIMVTMTLDETKNDIMRICSHNKDDAAKNVLHFDFSRNTEGLATGKGDGAAKIDAQIKKDAGGKIALFWPGDGNVWLKVEDTNIPANAPKAFAKQGGNLSLTRFGIENFKLLESLQYAPVADFTLADLGGGGKYYFDFKHPVEMFSDGGVEASDGNSKPSSDKEDDIAAKAKPNRFLTVSEDRILVTMTWEAGKKDIKRISSYPKNADKTQLLQSSGPLQVTLAVFSRFRADFIFGSRLCVRKWQSASRFL